MIRFSPGAYSGETKVAAGSEHAGLVLEGELELTLNGQRMLLKPGDSFSFLGSNPHRYGNPGRRRRSSSGCIPRPATDPRTFTIVNILSHNYDLSK